MRSNPIGPSGTFSRVWLQPLVLPTRKERVAAQYDTPEAPAAYVRVMDGSSALSRTLRSRHQLVQDILMSLPGGDLLDAGCGPGILARALLRTRPGDFSITVLDQSAPMIKYCAENTRDAGQVHATVGQLEALPFADGSFDVALIMGALEYADARSAVREVSRITRPGGLVILSMLNPRSLYRLTEWFIYWPVIRIVGIVQESLGLTRYRRHGAQLTGIRTFSAGRLQRLVRRFGLQPVDLIHYDVTPLVPPLDRLPAMMRMAARTRHERTVTRGWRRYMGTAYLIVARRA